MRPSLPRTSPTCVRRFATTELRYRRSGAETVTEAHEVSQRRWLRLRVEPCRPAFKRLTLDAVYDGDCRPISDVRQLGHCIRDAWLGVRRGSRRIPATGHPRLAHVPVPEGGGVHAGHNLDHSACEGVEADQIYADGCEAARGPWRMNSSRWWRRRSSQATSLTSSSAVCSLTTLLSWSARQSHTRMSPKLHRRRSFWISPRPSCYSATHGVVQCCELSGSPVCDDLTTTIYHNNAELQSPAALLDARLKGARRRHRQVMSIRMDSWIHQ